MDRTPSNSDKTPPKSPKSSKRPFFPDAPWKSLIWYVPVMLLLLWLW